MRKWFLKRLKGFYHGTHGSAIVEFALTFPLMLMFVYGAYELVTIGLIKQRAELTAQTIAQALSDRRTTIGACGSNVQEVIKNIPLHTLGRYNKSVTITVTALERINNKPTTTLWTARLNGTAPAAGVEITKGNDDASEKSIPFSLNPNEKLYVIDVLYIYNPIVKLFGTGDASAAANGKASKNPTDAASKTSTNTTSKTSIDTTPKSPTTGGTQNTMFDGNISAMAVSVPQSGELARWC